MNHYMYQGRSHTHFSQNICVSPVMCTPYIFTDHTILLSFRFVWFAGVYSGGTNFGRTVGGPDITTNYDYDGNLDEYGVPR